MGWTICLSLCVVGGAAAWVATDAAIISLDEYFNRDEFEAELRQLIDEDRARKTQAIEAALADKVKLMDEFVDKNFTLRDLP